MRKFSRLCLAGALRSALILVVLAGLFGCQTASASSSARSFAAGSRLDASSAPRVLTGLDVLQQEGFARLHGRNVAIIANHSSINSEGEHLLDLLVADPNVNVIAIFSPEHGFRGDADVHISDGKDEKTGLPIYSLYGDRRVPRDEDLAGVDTLIFDIQDVGARFYTYSATLGNCMKKAQEANLRFIVLDRPNPIQGNWFDGPIQDDDLVGGFTAFVPMSTAHGMTFGELANLYYNHHDIQPDLDIVAMKGWTRDMYFDETGLPWVNPSPNMRSVDEEILYTMVAQTEANKIVSVGRGTDRPFEYLGAPWIDGDELAANLNARNLPGLWFMRTTFVPAANDITGRKNYPYQFTGEICHGVRIVVVDRHRVSPVEAGIHMLDALMEVGGEKYSIDRLRGLVGAQWVLDALKAGEEPSAIAARWRTSPEFLAFAARRESALMY
ncbi:MAG: hypothetical protein PWP23_2510 [Candidatus Sumerlaeota bacterium]|nr:hypothetical protein [Candidatus Sumerlaeota bacterium]